MPTTVKLSMGAVGPACSPAPRPNRLAGGVFEPDPGGLRLRVLGGYAAAPPPVPDGSV